MSRTVQGGILALIIAIIASYLIPPRPAPLYVDLDIASQAPTTIQVFFDTGNDFNPQQSSSNSLPGRDEPWVLRFKLPNQAVDRIRIDFGEKAEQIVIRKVELFCLETAAEFPLALEDLAPHHDIGSITPDERGLRIQAGGPDPQLVVSVSELFTQRFSLRLVFLLALLLYPLAWVVVSVTCRYCNRGNSAGRLADGCPGARSGGMPHKILLGAAAVIMLLTCIHFFEMNRRNNAHLIAEIDHSVVPYTTPFNHVEERIIRPDGLAISSHLYRPESGQTSYPAFLLLHGNYPLGGSYPLYKVLARELADSGFVVMTIDFAGYGKSEDPFANGPETDLTFASETRAALDHLRRIPFVNPDRIGLIGHSMGADLALRVGLGEKEIASMVLIGPPRRVQERFHSPADMGFFWYWANKVRKEQYGVDGFPDWYSRDRWRNDILERDMMHLLPILEKGVHSPLLFIDGELEPSADRRFLADYVSGCGLPRDYITLGKTDHDCNVRMQNGSIYYDPAVMDELVAAIGRHHRQDRNVFSRVKDYFFNSLRALFRPPSFTIC